MLPIYIIHFLSSSDQLQPRLRGKVQPALLLVGAQRVREEQHRLARLPQLRVKRRQVATDLTRESDVTV